MSAFSDMKNAVIGNNKQKANLIVLGAVPRYVFAHLLTATPSHYIFQSTCHFFGPLKMTFKYAYCVFVHWLQVTIPAPAELIQSGATNRVFCGAGQPRHGHREQHQVPGGLPHHPCPSSRLGCTHILMHANTLCIGLHLWWLAETRNYRTPLFCARRSPLSRPHLHWSLSSMSPNGLHKSSHPRAAALYCRLSCTCCAAIYSTWAPHQFWT